MLRWPSSKDRFDGGMNLEMYCIHLLDSVIYYANIPITALSPGQLYSLR
jgi:hypothetical protein